MSTTTTTRPHTDAAAAPKSTASALLAANVVSLVFAIWQQWPPVLLIWSYTIQTFAIAFYSGRRIAALAPPGRTYTDTSEAAISSFAPKREDVFYFVLLFGGFMFFHLPMLLFVTMFGLVDDGGATVEGAPALLQALDGVDVALTLLLGAVFWWTQRGTFRAQRARDAARPPRRWTLMLMPFVRIVPIQIPMMIGLLFGSGAFVVIVFGLLKTLVDLVGHFVETRS